MVAQPAEQARGAAGIVDAVVPDSLQPAALRITGAMGGSTLTDLADLTADLLTDFGRVRSVMAGDLPLPSSDPDVPVGDLDWLQDRLLEASRTLFAQLGMESPIERTIAQVVGESSLMGEATRSRMGRLVGHYAPELWTLPATIETEVTDLLTAANRSAGAPSPIAEWSRWQAMALVGGLQALVSTLNAATDVFPVELKADAGASVVAQGSAGMVMFSPFGLMLAAASHRSCRPEAATPATSAWVVRSRSARGCSPVPLTAPSRPMPG